MKTTRTKSLAAAAVLVLAGFGVGAAVAATGSATAADDKAPSSRGERGDLDPSKSVRSDEHLLNGTKLQKVTAAAKAKYPGATIERVEIDSEGVYEAHIVTAGGEPLIVQVGADYTVTGTDSFGRRGPR